MGVVYFKVLMKFYYYQSQDEYFKISTISWSIKDRKIVIIKKELARIRLAHEFVKRKYKIIYFSFLGSILPLLFVFYHL